MSIAGRRLRPSASGSSPPTPAGRHLLSSWPAVALATVLYLAVLHQIHQHVIAPQFSYLQYTYRDPNPLYYGFAISLVVALALILPRTISRPSQFVAWVLFIVAIAPSIAVPQFTDVLSAEAALDVAIWVSVSYLPVAVLGTRRSIRGMLPKIRLGPSTFWAGVALLTAAIFVFVVVTVRPTWQLPSLVDVYGVRDEFKSDLDDNDTLGYVVPLLANVLNPLIVTRGLISRRPVWLVAGLLGQVFVFSFTGYRSALLSPLALIAAFALFRRNSRPPAALTMVGVAIFSAGMWVLDVLTASNEYTSLMVRRFLITPGLLTAAYVLVFTGMDKVAFSHSFLSSFLEYPYSQEPPLLVGSQFFENAETNANANLLADGYANLGFAGMLLECLVLVLLLWLADDACDEISIRVSSLVLLGPTLALADSGIFTAMLTHGFLVAIIACAVMPLSGWSRADRHVPARGSSRRRRRDGRPPDPRVIDDLSAGSPPSTDRTR